MIFKNKKAIIFDLDGTIVKLQVDWGHLSRLLTKNFETNHGSGYKFSNITQIFNKVLELGDQDELLEYFDIVKSFELKQINRTVLIKNVIFFINNLSLFGVGEDIILAILSLNMHETIYQALKLAGISDKFKLIVGKEDVRKWKPDPEGLLKIKEYFKLDPDEMVYFGDLQKDVSTGDNAGIDVYLIDELISLVKNRQEN